MKKIIKSLKSDEFIMLFHQASMAVQVTFFTILKS